MISEEKLRTLLEVLEGAKEYIGNIKEKEKTKKNKKKEEEEKEKEKNNTIECKILSYPVKGFAVDLAGSIHKFNTGVLKNIGKKEEGLQLKKNCDGIILCSSGKIILVELKTRPIKNGKEILHQIVASYISLCALLYIFSLNIKDFDVEIIIAGCIVKKDLEDADKKRASYDKTLELFVRLVRKGKSTIKSFPKDILKLLKLSKNIDLHPDIHKSDVPVSYHICDNCKEPA